MFGLNDKEIKYIQVALLFNPEIEEIIIFGSRAMGNYKIASDIDIAIKGKNLNDEVLFKFNELLNEEYPLPYFFDILDYNKIKNEKLKEHIDKFGIKFESSWRV